MPYPANYGGVIDIFYKLKVLHAAGLKIYLHCFVYGDRKPNDELNKYCEHVFYYDRKEKLSAQLSFTPYIVQSRKSAALLNNLLLNEYPILFEGLHCCGFLDHPKLSKRKKLVRMHNIEWQYYLALIPQTDSMKHKTFYLLESYKLKQFEQVLRSADLIFSVSDNETKYCSKFAKSIWLPAFHGNEFKEFTQTYPEKKYAIFHGNLDISDNRNAALLLDEICCELNVECIITGKNLGKSLVTRHSSLVTNPADSEMQQLIENAHICFVYTEIENGVKLKLYNSLFNGKFVVGNQKCVTGSRLDEIVIIANTKEEIKSAISDCLQKEFTEEEFKKRKALLEQYADNGKNAELILGQM